MKKLLLLTLSIVLISGLSACSNKDEKGTNNTFTTTNEKAATNRINDTKDVPSNLVIKDTTKNIEKEIIETKMVSDIFSVLRDTNWMNAKVEMSRPADYLLHFEIKKGKTKAVLYQIWLSPNKKQYEIVVDELNKYVKLSEGESETLKRAIEK